MVAVSHVEPYDERRVAEVSLGRSSTGPPKSSIKLCRPLMPRSCAQYMHQVMATFRKNGQRGRDGRRSQRIHRAHKLDGDPRPLPQHVSLPLLTSPLWAPTSPHRRLLARDEGQDRAGRCFPDLHQLYQRTRRVLMAHQERPNLCVFTGSRFRLELHGSCLTSANFKAALTGAHVEEAFMPAASVASWRNGSTISTIPPTSSGCSYCRR